MSTMTSFFSVDSYLVIDRCLLLKEEEQERSWICYPMKRVQH